MRNSQENAGTAQEFECWDFRTRRGRPVIDIGRRPNAGPASDAGNVLFIAAIAIVAMLLLASGCA